MYVGRVAFRLLYMYVLYMYICTGAYTPYSLAKINTSEIVNLYTHKICVVQLNHVCRHKCMHTRHSTGTGM